MQVVTIIIIGFFVGSIVSRIPDKIANAVAYCILVPYMWVFEPLLDFTICGTLYCFGYSTAWQYNMTPRFRRLRDRIKHLWCRLVVRHHRTSRTLVEPSRAERFLHTILLMSYDEVHTFEDTTLPYRSGTKIITTIHRASPLEKIFGVGLWPFT